jgi:hypothetical protein
MKPAQYSAMIRPILAALALLLGLAVAACNQSSGTGNPNTVRPGAGSGWENFRA